MALKTVIASLEDVSEDVRGPYIEKDGSFILDLEGVDAHPTVVNLKTAFERVKADKKNRDRQWRGGRHGHWRVRDSWMDSLICAGGPGAQ